MFYFLDIEIPTVGITQRHIFQVIESGGVRSFPAIDDNSNMVEYLAWLAEGNTPEEWNPDTQPTVEPELVEESMIEETPEESENL